MAGKNDVYERRVENWLFRRSTSETPPPATCYLALYEAAGPPGDAGGGTEASYPGYARQAVSMDTATWGALGTTPSNQATITFPAPTSAGPHPALGYFVLHEASTGDTPIVNNALVTERTPQEGVTLVFSAGAFKYSEG